MKLGIIGCGKIMGAYVTGARHYHDTDLVACADLDLARARERATEFEIPRACTVDELLADPEVDLVINLTVPQAHAEIDRRALEAGKHVHSEKPLALDMAEGRPLIELAAARNLRLGCAPDTFLGAGHQLARALIDEGRIGRPVSATAFMLCHGHESWHPSPQFYYQKGGGPLYDMGPYYLTALVNMLGPVARVCGFGGRAYDTRTITSQPLAGTVVPVEIDTQINATLEFSSGAIASLIMSFDTWKHTLPNIQVHGTEGSLGVPDPNGFGGEVKLSSSGAEWEVQEHRHEPGSRGAGPADIAAAIAGGRPHRASGELALHVLEIMEGISNATREGRTVDIATRPERPLPIPTGLEVGHFDR